MKKVLLFLGILVALNAVSAAISMMITKLAKPTPIEMICQKACYPNPVDRVVAKQCFCKADIVIREVPNGN